MEHIKVAYAIVNPSISDMNPNIVLEGLSVGKPFICTEESGIREVTEGMGLFVNPMSIGSIRDAILALADETVYDACRTRIASRSDERTYRDVAREVYAFAETV
jgi:glycosyltransferase involved in cell wall biosynthesis